MTLSIARLAVRERNTSSFANRIGYAQSGRDDLALKVKWISKDDDSLGYDILSYDEDGAKLYVEVKTTNAGRDRRFFITDNELAVARRQGKAYRLYRLFDPSRDARIYILTGPLDEKLDLKAKSYAATHRG
jgi:uncharacterized protein DUF3883